MQLCFVLMPFGRKQGPGGATIDFDAVWRELFAPAVADAGLEGIRADEEQAGGIIHKAMFERLILCQYAIADLTTANANVLYELGVRHGIKPFSTTLVFASHMGPLPFDVAMLRGLQYQLGTDGRPSRPTEDRAALTRRLVEARDAATDSPVYQLIEGFPDIQRLKTDVFREQVEYSKCIKERLTDARKEGLASVRTVEQELLRRSGAIEDIESGIVVDLFLSYRAVEAWQEMVDLVDKMPRPLAETTMVREQLGLALNRMGHSAKAEQVLQALIDEKGSSSETCGILGRVYKDQWQRAMESGASGKAKGWLKKAIATYLQGFETDWRDAYPGINAVTLMELADPPDPRRTALLPVVDYAVHRRIASGKPDYWDHATRLELAVLRRDQPAAMEALNDALVCVRESWEAKSTLNNLRAISRARAARGDVLDWATEVEHELEGATEHG